MQTIALTCANKEVYSAKLILNLASEMSINSRKVLLFDTDFLSVYNRQLDNEVGIPLKYTLSDLASNEITADKMLIDCPNGIKYMSAFCGDFMVTQNQKRYENVLIEAYLSLRNRFDYVLLDISSGLNKYKLDFLNFADRIVIVTTPDSSAIADSYAMIKALYFSLRSPVINLLTRMVSTEEEGDTLFEKFNLIVQHFLNHQIGNLGYLINDNETKGIVSNLLLGE